MATLLVSAAVNIGVGIVLNLLAPSKGQSQVGPRLSDLSVTSSAYGGPIFVHYGTPRTSGNVIWSPGIQEVVSTQTQGGKGGGAPKSSLTSFSYFASFAVSFGEGEADDLLRLWADGKLIYDRTGSTSFGGYKFRFYRGSETQQPDFLMEADKGVGNVPAHRGMCYLVAELWPLANFGNRIPNITAEIAYSSQVTAPFDPLILLSGQVVPGSPTGSDQESHFYIDPFTDDAYILKASGVSRSTLGSMSTVVLNNSIGDLFSDAVRYCMDGFVWGQRGPNFAPVIQYDPVTLEATGLQFGISNALGSWGTLQHYPRPVSIGVLRVGDPNLGQGFVDVYVFSGMSLLGDGGFVVLYKNESGAFVQDNHLDTDIGRGAHVMQDHVNRRLFVGQENDSQIDVWEVTAGVNVGPLGLSAANPVKRLVGTYLKGGTDWAGTGDLSGWCHVPSENALILSNAVSMVKVDVDTGAVLARNLALGFGSQEQYATSGVFAFGNGAGGGSAVGVVYTISTDDLAVVDELDLGIPFPGAEANYQRAGYDPRNHSILLSRVNVTNPASNRVVRILLGRKVGLGVPLSDVVADISRRSGLDDTLFDVSDLVSETVLGYSLTKQASGRSALEPLINGYLFEGAETDWRMRFVRRGGASVLTIDEDYLGRASTAGNSEVIKEVRAQEVELPGRFSVRFADKDKDYQAGVQSDKRVSLPTPSQYSRNEVTLDLPIVMLAPDAKRLAQRWLYTSWSERVSVESVLPWRYMRLDPTDVFELNFRGETRRLRGSRIDLGADLDTEFTATQEDAESNVSAVAADGGLGHPAQFISSALPTKLHLLDLPLLRAVDASLQQFSRAYWAVSAYEDSWPGATLMRSRDGASSFDEIGGSSVEATWGTVAGTLADPSTTTTWDESSMVDLKVVRGIGDFSSSTDLEVLNGANAIAIVRGDGLPEIIQFVNVTQTDPGTVRLSRLLRGRLGTEDNSRDHVPGERWVLLDVSPIEAMQLPLDLLDVTTQHRAVTFGTLLEDAPTTSFAYTGQDLMPYSVAQVVATRPGGDLALTWVRRTRFNGELLDGTDTVPLNEQAELYDVDFFEVGASVPFLTRTGLTSPATTLTTAEYNTATGLSASVVPTVEAQIYQVSATVGRGRYTRQLFELVGVDPFLAFTVLLLALDGADGATTSTDDSASAHTLTFDTPGAELDTAVKKFGTAALLLSGATTARVNVTGTLTDFDFGTDDFTVETWVNPTAGFGSDGVITRGTSGTGWWRLFLLITGTYAWFHSSSQLITGTTNVLGGGWRHLAVSRRDGVTRLFVNGVQEGVSHTASYDITASGASLVIGDDPSVANREMHGSQDEIRVTKGVGRYSGNFTPPAGPFPRV
jgi:hypothetical protein